MYTRQTQSIADMVGNTYSKVENIDNDILRFTADDHVAEFYHYQDCCESVYIESIDGSLDDLVGTPILMAEEVSGDIPQNSQEYEDDCVEWTFYKFATIKGYVTVRWYGTSNGYYSTSVDFSWKKVRSNDRSENVIDFNEAVKGLREFYTD